MSLREWFESRYIQHLEKEIEDLKAKMREDIVRLQTLHEAELNRVIAENSRLQSEINGIRLAAGQPGTIPEKEEVRQPVDPDAMPVFTGTSWEKVQQRERWIESPAGKRWMKANWDATPVPEQKETSSARS